MTKPPDFSAFHPDPTAQGITHAPASHHRPVRSGMVLTGLSLAILLSQLGTNIINVARSNALLTVV